MTPYYEAPDVTLWCGDALAVLATLPSASVQCCVTSPPYLGLRRYTDGDPAEIGGGTPAEYVASLVAVFRAVRRVLRPDGVLWLNLGDSMAGAGYSNHTNTGGAQREDGGKQRHTAAFRPGNPDKNGGVSSRDGLGAVPGAKAKDLIGVPWLVAFALREDGWWLRSEVIWHKLAPMPESVSDRPTRAHEQVFLLTKQATYYYDADAIREPLAEGSAERYVYAFGGARNEHLRTMDKGGMGVRTRPIGMREPTPGRNKRSVWSLGPEGFTAGDHFAVMPTKLVEPCILAGSRPGDTVLDPFCGSGTVPMVARRLGRQAVGIELNGRYCDMAVRRIEGQTPTLPLEEQPA